jgi:IS4 transposase
MVQELGWLPLVTRRQVSRLVNFHRVVHGQMGWSSVPGVSRGVYHGIEATIRWRWKEWVVEEMWESTPLPIERVGSGTLSLRTWRSWKRGGILEVPLLTATEHSESRRLVRRFRCTTQLNKNNNNSMYVPVHYSITHTYCIIWPRVHSMYVCVI